MSEVSTVKVSSEAKQAVKHLVDWSGQTQQQVVLRVLEWIGSQDMDVAGAIIGALPKTRTPDFARLVLENMAKTDEAEAGGSDDSPGRSAVDLATRRKAQKEKRSGNHGQANSGG